MFFGATPLKSFPAPVRTFNAARPPPSSSVWFSLY